MRRSGKLLAYKTLCTESVEHDMIEHMKHAITIAFLFLAAYPALAANDAVILPVPYTAQAPFGNWSVPWSDFCEEASVAMAQAYVTGRGGQLSAIDFAIEMLRLAIFELRNFGHDKDTGVAETLRMLRDYYGNTKPHIVYNPTSETIRNAILNGSPVIVPAAGQLLGNPHFKSPGPRYHMVVVKGFDHIDFIVNEPGTRFGNGWHYDQSTLMNAMHDFVANGDITTGRKAVIIVEK